MQFINGSSSSRTLFVKLVLIVSISLLNKAMKTHEVFRVQALLYLQDGGLCWPPKRTNTQPFL